MHIRRGHYEEDSNARSKHCHLQNVVCYAPSGGQLVRLHLPIDSSYMFFSPSSPKHLYKFCNMLICTQSKQRPLRLPWHRHLVTPHLEAPKIDSKYFSNSVDHINTHAGLCTVSHPMLSTPSGQEMIEKDCVTSRPTVPLPDTSDED